MNVVNHMPFLVVLIEKIKATAPFTYSSSPSSLTLHGAADAFNAVLDYAGASFARDKVDKRVTEEARKGTATYEGSNGSKNGLIDTQSDVGGWPEYKGGEVLDSDSDGMPDWFEEQFGLNKTNGTDGKAVSLDKNGRYTNLEMYLHYLVREIVAGGNTKGTYTKL